MDPKSFFDQLPSKLRGDSRSQNVVAVVKARHKLLTVKFLGVDVDLQPLILPDAKI